LTFFEVLHIKKKKMSCDKNDFCDYYDRNHKYPNKNSFLYIYKKKKTVLTTLQPKAFKTVCYGSHTKALKQFDTLPTQN